MTSVVAPKSWLSPFVMQYLAFPGRMMTLSKSQDGYLNKWVILFILQYETHSLQIHPESPFRSVVAPTPKSSEQRYALRLVVVPCRYLPDPSPFFQPILQYPSSHISSVVILHLLLRHMHPYHTASLPPCSSVAVLVAECFCHTHYTAFPPCLHCHLLASILWFSLHYLLLSRVLCCRCLYTFLDMIFSSLCVILYYTTCSALIRTTTLTL